MQSSSGDIAYLFVWKRPKLYTQWNNNNFGYRIEKISWLYLSWVPQTKNTFRDFQFYYCWTSQIKWLHINLLFLCMYKTRSLNFPEWFIKFSFLIALENSRKTNKRRKIKIFFVILTVLACREMDVVIGEGKRMAENLLFKLQ